jgi:hypothetical protein
MERLPSAPVGAGIRRRALLTAAAAGIATLALNSAGAIPAFAATNPIPTLPGEVSRLTNQVTARGNKQYENILVSINGDLARIMVPWTAIPGSSTKVGAVWFYHASGSSHAALNSAFKYPAELCVDQGAVAICQNAGGDQYTNQIAQKAQKDGWAYLSSVFSVGFNLLRANSGGGALACATYAAKLIPLVRGMYLASSAYDMEKLYATSPDRIGAAYGNSPSLLAQSNPARLSGGYWAGARVRVVGADSSNPDPVLPYADHGLALTTKITGHAIENSTKLYYDGGHQVPSWTSSDMMSAFQRWVG